MKSVALSDVATINPGLSANDRSSVHEAVSFLSMDAVSEKGHLSYQEKRPADQVMRGYTPFKRGDIILAKITPCLENGKAAYLDQLETEIGFGSTEFHVIRPSDEIDGKYLFYLIWNTRFRLIAENHMTGAAGQKRVATDFLKRFQIPLPNITQQRRIALILDKANDIRRRREEALGLGDDFIRATFLHLFGDPVVNPKGFAVKPLVQLCTFVSGGTPSKTNSGYWSGTFPWVSPKDMKQTVISDAQDRISDAVFEETSLKRIPVHTVLIVVRGMILAHTVPLAITAREVAINQDIKGIIFSREVDPLFGLWCLKVQHKHLLSKIDTAAHGTKRLDMRRLGQVPILVPNAKQQADFIGLWMSFSRYLQRCSAEHAESNALFASLSQRAFQGNL